MGGWDRELVFGGTHCAEFSGGNVGSGRAVTALMLHDRRLSLLVANPSERPYTTCVAGERSEDQLGVGQRPAAKGQEVVYGKGT